MPGYDFHFSLLFFLIKKVTKKSGQTRMAPPVLPANARHQSVFLLQLTTNTMVKNLMIDITTSDLIMRLFNK
jgi:hypothetical protein